MGEASAPKARGWGHHYDLNGNVASKSGEASYSWDFENRLTSANMTASGATVAHEYDVDGNRVQTAVTSSASMVTSNLLVDTTGSLSQVVIETDGSANLTALYVRVGDELLEVMRPDSKAGTWSTRFIHHDGLGSVRALTDETGTTIDTRGYEAFGTKNVEAGSDPLAYGFAGEPFQADSMLAYHRARWMDARVGRFEGMDRFEGNNELPISLHRYLYVANNPENELDPSGLISPLSLWLGQQVHATISEDFLSGKSTTLEGRVADVSIDTLVGGPRSDLTTNWVLKAAFGVGAWARPDLAATVDHAIYEIKSFDEFGQGQLKLYSYLNILNELDPASNWRAGRDDEYTPVPYAFLTNPISGEWYVEISPPEDGVITYTYLPWGLIQALGSASVGAASGASTDVSSLSAVGAGFL